GHKAVLWPSGRCTGEYGEHLVDSLIKARSLWPGGSSSAPLSRWLWISAFLSAASVLISITRLGHCAHVDRLFESGGAADRGEVSAVGRMEAGNRCEIWNSIGCCRCRTCSCTRGWHHLVP